MQENGNLEEFRSGGINAHVTLIVCSLLYMVNYMDRQVLSVVLEPMKLDLGLTDTQAGAIQTIFLMSVALFSFPIAFLMDRWSRRKSLGIMAILWSIFTCITGFGRNFATVIIPRTIVGVGEAAFAAAGTALIGAAYAQQFRSRVMGVFNMAIPIGAAIGVILGGYLSANYGGWRTPFYVFAVPGILLGIIAFFLKDYRTVVAEKSDDNSMGLFQSALRLLRIPTLRWMYIGQAMHGIVVSSFLTWIPAYIMRAHGVTEDKAGLLTAAIGIMAVIGAPLGGFLADLWYKRNRKGRMLLAVVSIPLASVCFIGAILLKLQGFGLVLGLLFGVLIVLGVPSFSAISQDVVAPDQKSMVWGMSVLCQYVLGGGWGPLMVGFLSQTMGGNTYGLTVALIVSACFGFVASIFLFVSAQHYSNDMDHIKSVTLLAEK
jgi:MFS family permease